MLRIVNVIREIQMKSARTNFEQKIHLVLYYYQWECLKYLEADLQYFTSF